MKGTFMSGQRGEIIVIIECCQLRMCPSGLVTNIRNIVVNIETYHFYNLRIGDKWKERRKFFSPMFHFSMLEGNLISCLNQAITESNRLHRHVQQARKNSCRWSAQERGNRSETAWIRLVLSIRLLASHRQIFTDRHVHVHQALLTGHHLR